MFHSLYDCWCDTWYMTMYILSDDDGDDGDDDDDDDDHDHHDDGDDVL